MKIQIHDQKDGNFPVKISGIDVIPLYGTGANTNCNSYACYVKLKDPPSLNILPAMPVNLATGYKLCPIGLTCCELQ